MKRSGLSLAVLLISVLIIALLVTMELKSLSRSGTSAGPAQDPVQQAQEAVDAFNERIAQSEAAITAMEG